MRTLIAFLLALGAMAQPAFGIILHLDAFPSSRPSDAVLGRWSSNASCVVIGQNYVVTTKHQGGGVGTTVTIDGQAYRVAEIFNSTTDLRVARLEKPDGSPANLTEFAKIHPDPTAAIRWEEVTIGGFGMGRGTALKSQGTTYGYLWLSSSNSTFRWGTNVIDRTDGIWLYADFDGIGEGGATSYEAGGASYDSGGGWFIRDQSGQWLLVGLSQGVERSGESWFRNASNPSILDPDRLYAVDVRPYAQWIGTVAVPEPSTVFFMLFGTLIFIPKWRRASKHRVEI